MRSLRPFLDRLRTRGELLEVEAPVDPRLELAEIHRRVAAVGGPALLFRRVGTSPFPVVTNLFGTPARIELAFGRRPERLVRELATAVRTLLPPSPRTLWAARRLLREAFRVGLATRRSGPVLEVVEQPPRLDRLPALTLWPEDGGPFITLALVYTEHPETRQHNLGLYRLQVYDSSTTGMHWQIGKGGGFHYAVAEGRGEALPVTAFLGGPPALVLAAIAPLPEPVGELLLASLLLGERLPLVPSPVGPHRLVAEAEFALVGRVPPRVRRPEGPFGDHYGYYSLRHDYPVFEVEATVRRRDAIYPATVVGKPRQEDFHIGNYLQTLLAPLFPLVMPGVRDLWSYGDAGFHSLAAAVVAERYPREAMTSAFRILGEGQLALTKVLLVTDTPQDLRDFPRLLEHLLARVRWERDLFVLPNLSMDTLDYTGPEVNRGSKAIVLGVGDPVRTLPRAFAGEPPADVRGVAPFCAGCLVVAGRPYAEDPEQPARLARHPAFAGWPLLVLADDLAPARSAARFLWQVFTRFEPAADLHAAAAEVARTHLVRRGPIAIDARMKPAYPKEVEPAPETVRLVDRRWREYFPERDPLALGTGEMTV
ncbi:MAG TPA: UbiD family decarboxylase [Thermodesulfobacteriota bacterium]|nr:UbiD family decarboxylase [Thermodesulfobacteriota bacterium]